MSDAPQLIPTPESMHVDAGSFRIDDHTVIHCTPDASKCAELLADYLQVTGHRIPITTSGTTSGISLRIDRDEDLGAEGYRLDVTTAGAVLSAPAADGLRHGIQTLRQLLPPDAYSSEPHPGVVWSLPCAHIVDEPRFAWRGSLLDPARWFLPIGYLYRYVDALAMHKLNRLHLHLTDDQGWRIEIERYPRLTDVGAWRKESPLGHQRDNVHDGVRHGGYYTQAELRDLVRYAAVRGVEIVPEIDLPGHVTAVLAAYPELGNTPDVEVARNWSIHSTVLNLEPATVDFFRNVLTEILDVFPGRYVHLGGDEVPPGEWETNPAATARLQSLGIPADQAHVWFINQLVPILAEHGRTAIVWDEAATPDLDPRAVVMSWTSAEAGIAAARLGHRVIMTPMQRTYFDWYQVDGPHEPVALGGLTTLRDVVEFDPAPPQWDAEVRARILGTQGQLWGEYLPTPARVDDMAFPRLCALAERAWSSDRTDYDDFSDRLATHEQRLIAAGIGTRCLLRPD
jgi:hexosaminidase